MNWIRGAIFTVLVPGFVSWWVPQQLRHGLRAPGGWWRAGWILFAAALLGYLQCLVNFLIAGGTPAIFFTKPIRFLLGEEPGKVVKGGLYRYSRNPMYISVISAIVAQAIVYRSYRIAVYGLCAVILAEIVVVFIEEPHLERLRGSDYLDYRRRVPRWFGLPRP
jgi:protein-S-isoprenylcysteine O-methyltransferase Ste14